MRGSVLRHARSIEANESRSNFGTGWAVGWAVWSSNPCKLLKELVGASGFEPPTSWSRTRRSAKGSTLLISDHLLGSLVLQSISSWRSSSYWRLDHRLG